MSDDPEAADATEDPAADGTPPSSSQWASPDPAHPRFAPPDPVGPEVWPPDAGRPEAGSSDPARPEFRSGDSVRPESAPPVPGADAGGTPVEAPPRRRRRRAAVVLGVAGVVGLVAGVTGVVLELNRPSTRAERAAAGSKELAARWRIRSAGEIFPPTVRNASGLQPAYRIGIAQPTGCADALDAQVARTFIAQGCRAVLRATYTDASRTLLTTVGVVVMSDSDEDKVETALRSLSEDGHNRYGLRVVPFPDTPAADWDDTRRQETAYRSGPMPYVILQVSGWVDGRTTSETADKERFKPADTLLDHLAGLFVKADDPCKARGVRC
ncbi:hypothetical protein GCM10023195_14020 [Actinoallomurus liliacearum]|uniref:Uncharacterized protein n=1 Tax=Actinoallomurus liliacearum TaxID=1080073 RepID=A0ABP8THA4_9ACTN